MNMASINDWAAKAARRIRSFGKLPSESSIAAIIETHAKPLLDLLREAYRKHDDACVGSIAADESDDFDETYCTCGAAKWNKRIDRALEG